MPTMSNDTGANNNNNDTENEHLLENKWVLWYRPPTKTQNAQASQWEANQLKRFTADTVENFWRGFRNHPRISKHGHPVNCDYSLFKEGIKPAWEDDFNKNGGRWTYTIERRQVNNAPIATVIEQSWLDVMLCLIGEGFDPYGDMVGGGVCGIRAAKGPNKSLEPMCAKLHIWTKDAGDTAANMQIGERLKEILHAPDGQLVYCPHETAGAGRRGHTLKL